jgi:hypothetical protein
MNTSQDKTLQTIHISCHADASVLHAVYTECNLWLLNPNVQPTRRRSSTVFIEVVPRSAQSNLFICHSNLSPTCSTKQGCRRLVLVVVAVRLALRRYSIRYAVCAVAFLFDAIGDMGR